QGDIGADTANLEKGPPDLEGLAGRVSGVGQSVNCTRAIPEIDERRIAVGGGTSIAERRREQSRSGEGPDVNLQNSNARVSRGGDFKTGANRRDPISPDSRSRVGHADRRSAIAPGVAVVVVPVL